LGTAMLSLGTQRETQWFHRRRTIYKLSSMPTSWRPRALPRSQPPLSSQGKLPGPPASAGHTATGDGGRGCHSRAPPGGGLECSGLSVSMAAPMSPSVSHQPLAVGIIRPVFSIFAVLGVEPRPSCMPGKCSTSEWHPSLPM
jgi:hypothetical protein